jgi:fimbrial isopeptide formation D2 family protein
MAKLAKDALAYAESNSEITAVRTATIAQDGTTTTVENLELGYYLVDSSLGSLCALDTTNREVTINEKNTVPTVDKKIVEGENRLEESYSQIGDVVEYETTITVAAGAKNYTLYDDMEIGLTYNEDVKVYVNDVEVSAKDKFTVTTPENHTFVIAFANSYIDTLEVGTNIVVKYSATLNKDAEISTDSNDNTTYLIYGDSNKYTTVPAMYSIRFCA